jgi:hypothetical protein
MRLRTVLVILCLVSTLSLARTPKAGAHTPDAAYGSALAAANRFLNAWQAQDHETGIIMLTDAARQHTTPELLQTFFSPGERPAYEISRGRRMNDRAYVFPVVLFATRGSRPHYCKIIVTRSGKDDWAIENLP